MIGVDWGTTSFRAFRLRNGQVLARRDAPLGILSVPSGGFAQALETELGPWLDDGETHVLLSGMVGSRQGWAEAPYLRCPAGAEELAAALTPVPFTRAQVAVIPGLATEDPAGVPEVMRGEETQLAGAVLRAEELTSACLPGTHSKWARLQHGRVVSFTTHLTGEAYAALRGHTILGRTMQDGDEVNEAAFLRGVERAGEAGGLLHHLFGVRTLALFGGLSGPDGASYLSGLLIGHEVAEAPERQTVALIGAPPLCRLYALALAARGIETVTAAPDVAASGLARIAELAGWS